MVVDHYIDKWPNRWPNTVPYTPNLPQWIPNSPYITPAPSQPNKDAENWTKYLKELENIQKEKAKERTRAEIEEFRELLRRAKEYDTKNNEPHCESDEKIKKLIGVLDRLPISEDDKQEILHIVNPT